MSDLADPRAPLEQLLATMRRKRTCEAWLFGSRVTGEAVARSDWDVLLLQIDPGAGCTRWQRDRLGNVDLVRVAWNGSAASSWLTSDLAAHVAAFGVPLVAGSLWPSRALPRSCAPQKRAKVLARLQRFDARCALFSERHRLRRALLLRRDVQRVLWLERGEAVPPNARLDAEWAGFGPRDRRSAIAALAGSSCVSDLLVAALAAQ